MTGLRKKVHQQAATLHQEQFLAHTDLRWRYLSLQFQIISMWESSTQHHDLGNPQQTIHQPLQQSRPTKTQLREPLHFCLCFSPRKESVASCHEDLYDLQGGVQSRIWKSNHAHHLFVPVEILKPMIGTMIQDDSRIGTSHWKHQISRQSAKAGSEPIIESWGATVVRQLMMLCWTLAGSTMLRLCSPLWGSSATGIHHATSPITLTIPNTTVGWEFHD